MIRFTIKVLAIVASFSLFNISFAEEDQGAARFDLYMSCVKKMMDSKPQDRASEVESIRQFSVCIGESNDPIMKKMGLCMGNLADQLKPYIDDPKAVDQQKITSEVEACLKEANPTQP
jgi:hypothetical protein